ncbi:MAG: hypothetical protein P8P20_15045, partial [Acidimicrobiales bacterium]|nr:hypothetical protein [Acidimicrobiales bacterium]
AEFGIEAGPVTSVFFRPEEIHTRSTEWSTGCITADHLACIPDRLGRFSDQHLLVTQLDDHRFTTTETRRFDANC